MKDPLDSIEKFFDFLATPRESYKASQRFEEFSRKSSLTLFYLLSMMVFILYLIFTAALLLSPIFIQSESKTLLGLGAITYNLVSLTQMCHQLPMRSIFLFGVQMAVCARDTGIFLGIAAGGLAFIKGMPAYFKKKRIIILATIPIAIDGVSQTILNLRESNNILRIATGFIFGFGLMLFILYRIKRFNQPEFKSIVQSTPFQLTLIAFTMAAFIALASTANQASEYYASKEKAVEIATGSASQKSDAYYIPSRTLISYRFYQNKDMFNDFILSDISQMKWIEEDLNRMLNATQNFDESQIALEPLRHYYGLWTVVNSDEAESKEGAVYSNKEGTYYYIDAKTGEVVETVKH